MQNILVSAFFVSILNMYSSFSFFFQVNAHLNMKAGNVVLVLRGFSSKNSIATVHVHFIQVF